MIPLLLIMLAAHALCDTLNSSYVYSKLATIYIRLAEPIEHPLEALPKCDSCVLFQFVNNTLHLHDPHNQRLAALHRQLRLREAVMRLSHVAKEGVNDTMILLALGDETKDLPRGCFAVVRCKGEGVIPFPIVHSDAIRRATGESENLLENWEEKVREFLGGTKWEKKKNAAVFRGRIRTPRGLSNEEYERNCTNYGRTALKAVAEKVGAHLLDVQVEGRCGKRVYVSDGMSMGEQMKYRYVIHTAGYAGWADRLIVLMFGGSVILKEEGCRMFFEPTAREFVHYLPLAEWREIKKQADQLREWEGGEEMVRDMRKWAAEFLGEEGVRRYVRHVVRQWSAVQGIREEVVPGAVQVWP